MKSRIWTGCAVAVALSGVVEAGEKDEPPVPAVKHADASAVCRTEKLALEEKRREYLGQHPIVVLAQARSQAACQPAPTADCAVARAEVAAVRLKYLERHPEAVSARTRAEALCAPAPNPACARARADLADAKARYLEKHPQFLAAKQIAEHHCGSAASKGSQATADKPRR